MASRRVDVRAILADPDLRRKLMVSSLQAKQAREGIATTEEQAERAYYVVTEGERSAFFALERFKGGKGRRENRQVAFVEALGGRDHKVRYDVARRDFDYIESAVLAYQYLQDLGPLFRTFPPLDPSAGYTRSGLNTTDIERFVRFRWEAIPEHSSRTWVTFAKGGDFCRFYYDLDLVFDWTQSGREFKGIVASKYGSPSRFVKSEDEYFKSGIHWVQTTVLGINARLLPDTGIFGVASPSLFPADEKHTHALLGVLNSAVFDALAHCVATRNWGSTAIGTLPIPPMTADAGKRVGTLAADVHDAKATWDEGNEISTRFRALWLLRENLASPTATVPERLNALARHEAAEEARIQRVYAELNDEVYKLYGIPDKTRDVIEETLGDRPPEVIWPQMEGKSKTQKRMEHVCRLLSHAVGRVMAADEDGIVPFTAAGGEQGLHERVLRELHALFPARDPSQVEVEITNELKRKVKGYRTVDSIAEWLDNAFFEFHVGLYKKRPILWHLASAHGTGPFAFGVLVDYRRFDKNQMAKLRGGYLRDAVESFRREAGLADKEGRAEDRVEWQARVEEAQALDQALQRIQEGHVEGAEEGPQDYRILTPWKDAAARPRGWDPDLDDGVKVNIEPLEKAGVLRVGKVT